jgi:hypothetical protein
MASGVPLLVVLQFQCPVTTQVRYSPRSVEKRGEREKLKKNMSKTFPKKIGKFLYVSFSSSFLFIAFLVVSQRREFKNTTKQIAQKPCRNVFTKQPTKKTRFFLDFF